MKFSRFENCVQTLSQTVASYDAKIKSTIGLFLFCPSFVVAYPMSGWVCQWKAFWIPVGDSSKKAFVEEWVFISDEPSHKQRTVEVLCSIAKITVIASL